jgi:DNA-binding response OmpR family regulator
VGLLRSSGIKILVIETDEAYRRHLAERIRLEGYKVYEACREAEAQHVIEKKSIDVVLLGFAGDKQRGLALLRSIRRLRPCPEVILLTFADDHSLAASIEGMKLGAFDELLVPFNVDTLLRRIQEAWQRKNECERAGRKSKETEGRPARPGDDPNRDGHYPEGKKPGS